MKRWDDAKSSAIRRGVIGLGERSLHKSHFLELQERQAELERFRTLLDDSSEAIFFLETPSGRTLDVNASACAALGVARAAVLGRPLADSLPDADAARLTACLALGAPGDPVLRLDTTLRRPDGSELAMELAVRLVEFRGTTYAAAVARDVAERRAAEIALRAAKQAAEATERVKSEFLTISSHDLRTPLATLTLLVQAGRRDLRAGVPVRDERLAAMEKQLARLRRMAAALLDVARLERGPLALERAPFDLRALVDEIVDEHRASAPAHAWTVDAPSEPLVVNADRERVAQVLTNLLDNAVRFSPADSAIEVALAADPAAARVSVTDHGIGISPEHAPRIFSRFGWPLGEAEHHGEGLGLGLHLCREIVRGHGGEMSFTSQVGGGTTFEFALPLGPSPAGAG
jgi:PAS domain S-box-containing protein